jgi:hypothetical protein
VSTAMGKNSTRRSGRAAPTAKAAAEALPREIRVLGVRLRADGHVLAGRH